MTVSKRLTLWNRSLTSYVVGKVSGILLQKNDTFYVSRAIPSDLLHRFNKRKIEVSLRTKSEAKAAKSAAALSDRLERYWDSLRMEMIYSRELGLRVTPDAKTTTSAKSFSMTEALALYHRLKGGGKTKLFFESSERSMRYLTDCLGHDDLAVLEVSDAGRFRDYLFDRGMSWVREPPLRRSWAFFTRSVLCFIGFYYV